MFRGLILNTRSLSLHVFLTLAGTQTEAQVIVQSVPNIVPIEQERVSIHARELLFDQVCEHGLTCTG